MRRPWTARAANGVVSALVVAFFLAHGTLGTSALLTGGIGPLAWLVWVGMGLVGAHVVLSIATSHQQLADAQRPPSTRKKRHLALKWATGILLAACVAAHIALPMSSPLSPLVITVLSAALGIHVCVGAKSLLKDIGVDRRHKTAFRILVCLFTAAFALAAIATLLAAG